MENFIDFFFLFRNEFVIFFQTYPKIQRGDWTDIHDLKRDYYKDTLIKWRPREFSLITDKILLFVQNNDWIRNIFVPNLALGSNQVRLRNVRDAHHSKIEQFLQNSEFSPRFQIQVKVFL